MLIGTLFLLTCLAGLIVAGNTARTKSCDAFLALDAGTWRLRLYTNNYTPLRTSVSGDFTEPTYTGYAGQAFAGWGASAIDGSGNATSTGTATRTFQPTANTSLPQTVYGYYVLDGSGNFLWAERLSSSFTFVDTNSVLTFTPKFSEGTLA